MKTSVTYEQVQDMLEEGSVFVPYLKDGVNHADHCVFFPATTVDERVGAWIEAQTKCVGKKGTIMRVERGGKVYRVMVTLEQNVEAADGHHHGPGCDIWWTKESTCNCGAEGKVR